MPTTPLAASGDVQTYQIRAGPASTIASGVVMASSPALPTQGATEEVTRKREVRLMKNRYERRGEICVFVCLISIVVLLLYDKFPNIQAGVFVKIHIQQASLKLVPGKVPNPPRRMHLKDKLCLILSTERQPVNVAGRRRSMLSVWKTELLSWRTKTRH